MGPTPVEVKSAAQMGISLQDFFRPDPQASNRSLRKYLEGEGLELGFRDLVSLRAAAAEQVFLSFALLEGWAEGEFGAQELSSVLQCKDDPSALAEQCQNLAWSHWSDPEGGLLLGVEGELVPTQAEPSQESSAENVAMVPLNSVFGGGLAVSTPGAGGVWNEDELQADSVTLLDGESDSKLVEAFRHLFRAAPDGRARAAVVATALARHRHELNLEVAKKMEELSPALGQALRQIFSGDAGEGCQALRFLLFQETQSEAPPWLNFWLCIKNSVLESLTRSEGGCRVLRESLKELSRASSAQSQSVLTHRILDALMEHQHELGPRDRTNLMELLVHWTEREPSATEILESRLKLAPEQNERILLGEALRRTYLQQERPEALKALVSRFSQEALSVGGTAGSLAMGKLLSSFGAMVLDQPALTSLTELSSRQTLRALEIWETLVSEEKISVERIAELFVQGLESAPQHTGILLKSSLLEREAVEKAFAQWCQEAEVATLRKLVSAGHHWGLSVVNRPRVARVLGQCQWHGLELWEQEWKKTTLGFQRLGWLAQCLAGGEVTISAEVENRILELLEEGPRNLYLWDLLQRVARFEGLSHETRSRIVSAARSIFDRLESKEEEEREATLQAAAAALGRCENPSEMLERWGELLKQGRNPDLWWVFGLVQRVFSDPDSPFQPERPFVAALIQRLFQSGPVPMQRVLAEALNDEDEDTTIAPVLSLELQNAGLEALAAVASHPDCPGATRGAIERRLVMFLLGWTDKLARTRDVYSFRSTPLFALLRPLISSEQGQLQELLDKVAEALLDLQRQDPEKLRLDVRGAAQQFLRRWVEARDEKSNPKVGMWRRALDDLAVS